MSRRRNPLTEGSLAQINDLFILPILKNYAYGKMNEVVFLEWLFDIEHRDIQQYQAKKAFRVPGLYYYTASQKMQGIGHRDVTVGAQLFIRIDKKRPNQIDVEIIQKGIEDVVFCLTPTELNSILINLSKAA